MPFPCIQSTHYTTCPTSALSWYSAVIALFFTCVELPVLVGCARPKFVVSLPQLKEGSGELDMENYVQV